MKWNEKLMRTFVQRTYPPESAYGAGGIHPNVSRPSLPRIETEDRRRANPPFWPLGQIPAPNNLCLHYPTVLKLETCVCENMNYLLFNFCAWIMFPKQESINIRSLNNLFFTIMNMYENISPGYVQSRTKWSILDSCSRSMAILEVRVIRS
jgi:hypothetical protein